MKLRLEKKTEVVTIKVGDDEAKFTVLPLTPREGFKLLEAATDSRGRNPQPDFYKLKLARIDKIIIDWEGIEDEAGNPIPCTTKNKELVYNFNQALIDEVLDEADRLADIREKQKEDDLKN